jgi:two-component system, LuxR family, sensor kinase FixL
MDPDPQADLTREICDRLAHLCWVIQSRQSDAGQEKRDSRNESTQRQAPGVFEDIVHFNQIMSMGQFAAALAHELAQPLAAIRTNVQAAERLASLPKPDLGEIRAALADIAADDQRAQNVVQNMRTVFQKRQISLHAVDLNRVVNDIARLVRHDAELRGVRIRLLLSAQPVLVQGDYGALQQILLNLVNNGMDAMKHLATQRRVLSLTTRVENDPGYGSVQVEDNGPGISKERKTKLFTPFFTTKSEGLGIGLSICRSLAEFLHGRVRLENRTRPGSAFVVEIPLAAHDTISKAA